MVDEHHGVVIINDRVQHAVHVQKHTRGCPHGVIISTTITTVSIFWVIRVILSSAPIRLSLYVTEL